jgi:hypothetical protein
MPNVDRELLKSALTEVLEERSRIDAEMHADHHAFIAILIEKHQRRNRIFEKLIEQVLGWGIISVLGFIGYQFLVEFKGILVSLLNKLAK